MERFTGLWSLALAAVVATLASLACIAGPAHAAQGDILVTDLGPFSGDGFLSRVVRVDPVTGELEVISSNGVDESGPELMYPSGIAISDDGKDVFVTNSFGNDEPGGVLHVNPETGDRSRFSYNQAPTGGPFEEPEGIAIEANGDLLVVDSAAAGGGGAVIRVDRETREPTILSSNASPEGGPSFDRLTAIAVAANGSIYVAHTQVFGEVAGIIRVDPDTGERTTVSSNTAPAGDPKLQFPTGLAVDSNGDLLVSDHSAFIVDDSTTGGVIRVNPSNGARTVVSANDDPRDLPNFESTEGIAIADDGDLLVPNQIFIGEGRSSGNVIEVKPTTGRRSTLSRDGEVSIARPTAIAVGPPTVDVIVDSAPAVVGPGAPVISFSELVDEHEPLGESTGETIAGSPLRSSPLRSSPLRSSPLRSSPLRSSPLRSSPLRSSALGPIMLVELPLRSSSWEELLAGTALDGPINAITLDQVFALNPLPQAIFELTLADIDIERSPLRSSAIGVVLLGDVAVAKLAPPENFTWCNFLPPGCDLSTELIAVAQEYPDIIEAYLEAPVPLNGPGVDVSDSTLATIRVADIDLARTTLAGRDLSAYQTVGDLIDAVEAGELNDIGVLYLADITPGLVAPNDFPFELASLEDVLANAPLRDDDPVSYKVTTSVGCQTGTLSFEVRLPTRARYLPGTARATFAGGAVDLPDPSDTTTPTLTFDASDAIDPACAPTATSAEISLEFDAEAPSRLGAPRLSARVRVDDRSRRGSGTDTSVNDVDDPGETVETSAPLPRDAILSGYLADEQDVDTYRLRAPAAGSVVTVVLSHLPADYDVTVTGPPVGIESAPLRSSPLRSSPLRSSPLRDDLDERGETGTPDTLQDIPLRSSDLESTPLRSSSINRSTDPESASFKITEADQGKDFIVRVTGFNGANSVDPYVLRTEVVEPPPVPPCRSARSLPAGQTKGFFPALPLASDTKTLILVNQQRLAQLYPGADIAALRTQLSTLAARDEVDGAVIAVESDPARDTDAAYAAWDADPCSVEKANAVGSDVLKVLKHVATGLNELRHVVIVGGDEVIPQVRVPDLTSIANEREEAGSLVFGGKDTATSRALREGYILTDDAYGDADPQAWLDGETFVPDMAVGRLVETPDQIAAQLTKYTDSSGALSEASTHVAGYDFLSDGATKVLEQLTNVTPAGQVSSDISETWTAADAEAKLNRQTPGFSSVNAHYDHYRALPAAAFNGNVPNLLRAATVSPQPGSLLFTAGCHAGLNVNDVGAPDAGPLDAPRLLDWTEKIADSQAVYVANTTYGYGDTEAVAYSERLLELFAEGIASRDATAGQALMIAKQRYAAELLTPGVYDVKAAQGLTFYGLPFFRIGPNGGEAPSVLPRVPSGGSRLSDSFAVTPVHSEVGTPRGSYWTADGERPQVSHFRPIQPRVTLDVTPNDGRDVHGAVVETLESTEEFDVDPVFSRPTIDHSDAEPEISSEDSVFPASIQRTTLTAATNGLRDLLVLVSGQFQSYQGSSQGVQSLFDRIEGTVYRSGSTDFDPPILRDISGRVTGGEATFRAASDDTDVIRGVVLFHDFDREVWRTVEMSRVGTSDVWEATADVVGFSVEAFTIQLVDAAGNVGVSTNKGPGYAPLPKAGEQGEPELLREPALPASGFHTGPVTLTIDPRTDGETYQVTIDGAPPTAYDGPFTVSGDGRHEVSFTGSDGSSGSAVVNIDSTPPTVTPVITPAPSAEGFNTGPVTVTWQCTDNFSGVATCPPPVTVSGEGANQTVTSGPARDVAGNTSTGTALVSIDLTPPTVTINRPTLSFGFFQLLLSRRLTGTATDAVSGIRGVQVQYARTLGGGSVTRTATVTCTNATRRSCTWSAPSPGLGFWRATATATDRAGRTASATLPNVLSVLPRR